MAKRRFFVSPCVGNESVYGAVLYTDFAKLSGQIVVFRILSSIVISLQKKMYVLGYCCQPANVFPSLRVSVDFLSYWAL